MTLRSRADALMGLAALATLASGCAGPLVVSSMQSRADEVQFGYTQAGSGNQGIIECHADGNGELHDCRHMTMEFID